jgi:hypothetical protein
LLRGIALIVIIKLKNMEAHELENYLREKLTELGKNLDQKEYVLRGKLNFGINKAHYSHLPSWNEFIKSKRRLLRVIWVEAFTTVFLVATFLPSFWDTRDQEWWKVAIITLAITFFLGGFLVSISFFATAFEVNRVQKNVRRLIYEDILYKIQQNKEELVP